jgi:hypothetical protein
VCDSHEVCDVDLHHALDAALEIELDDIDDEALHELVVSTGRAEARLAAAKARLLAEWDQRKVWKSNGALRANVRLGNELGISSETAFVEMRRARKLQGMPSTFEAFAHGDISVDHVEMLCRANAGDLASEFPDSEKSLVDACVTQRYQAAARTITYWRQYTDPAGEDHSAAALVARRSLWCRRMPNGTVRGGFCLDPLNGAAFLNEIHRLERRLRDAELAEHGECVRTVGQRRADVVVEMATRSASTPKGAQRPRPLYTLLVGYETFAGRLCELDDGTVIAPGLLIGDLGDADIERIVFDAPDRVLSVSRRRRFAGALRRAIEVRDRQCQHPSGCDVPAPRCDIDHVTPWTQTRDTSQVNGRVMCAGHNRHGQPGRPPPGG